MGKVRSLITALFILCFYNISFAQNCCMEILGGSRISFGYGVRSYGAEGFNNYINVYNQNRPQLNKKMDKFGMGMGFHGAIDFNYLVDPYDYTYMSFGFQYEHVNESHEANAVFNGGIATREYVLSFTALSMNMSVSLPMARYMDWTVLGGSLDLYNATLKNNYKEPGISKTEKLSSESTFGGEIYSGVRLYLFTNFVSIETLIGYSFVSIPTLNFENGNSLSRTENDGTEMDNFMSGGFYGKMHLSIGIPNLY
ncbi:MAG TPA: hypothetical protein VFF33_05505 [Ignavibacteriaceae bacterium]|nr:hypothetical protein [Ignavibacteriaceae bacterium]